MELISREPWLLVVMMALSIPIVAVILGTVTQYLTAVRRAELDARLKHEMLQSGMSAEEIRLVIEASSHRKPSAARRHYQSEGQSAWHA